MRWAAGAMLVALLTLAGCGQPDDVGPPVRLHEVSSIEITFVQGPLEDVEEVHRLQQGAGQRVFERTSEVTWRGGQPKVTTGTVPPQRVAEVLRAAGAPTWSRQRAVDMAVRRLRPETLIDDAVTHDMASSGCTVADLRRRMGAALRGDALRAQLLAYYGDDYAWTDDAPSLRMTVRYDDGTETVVQSTSQKVRMLPWQMGGPSGTPRLNWSVPLTEAIARVLPPTSAAAERLEDTAYRHMTQRILRTAQTECAAGGR
ncbi:hypothetical protein ACLB90_12010 [Stenotrophomonas sp. LGBM10]|uniref:hypothetical protein n=1 Tax=Stenotrophomonas sp. LGBM10 TaxID=3390038 RepID=UPI00398B5F17